MSMQQHARQGGSVEDISPLVRRVLAPNPGMMTGPGTNTYLVGRNRIAVIDPGTDDPNHLRRIVELGGGKIEWIMVTHTHPDHSTGSRELQALTGAVILGHQIRLQGIRDESFAADAYLADGDAVSCDEFCLRALHTPGHAANHLCFLLEEEHLLFAGDHVMQGTTVVINPPDGDMRAYLSSLERLKGEPIRRIAPGHGTILEHPPAVFDAIIEHRLQREDQILTRLRDVGPVSVGDLVADIYKEVPAQLHSMAARSVLAHLYKLQDDKVASPLGDHYWGLTSSSLND